MEGFKMLAESYKEFVKSGKFSAEAVAGEIKTLEFLGTCSKEEVCLLFNSSAFNDIVLGYVSEAIRNTELSEKEEIEKQVLRELRGLFDYKSAGEIIGLE